MPFLALSFFRKRLERAYAATHGYSSNASDYSCLQFVNLCRLILSP